MEAKREVHKEEQRRSQNVPGHDWEHVQRIKL